MWCKNIRHEMARLEKGRKGNARSEDKALGVTVFVGSKRLHDLRHVEEGDGDGVVLQYSQSVLQENRVVAELREEEPQGLRNRDRGPVEQVL